MIINANIYIIHFIAQHFIIIITLSTQINDIITHLRKKASKVQNIPTPMDK